MALSDSFIRLYDKTQCKAAESVDKWIVVEHDSQATMTHLEVNAEGKFLGFNQDLVKEVKDTTTKMSSKLEDKDCDGIAFLQDLSQQEHLIFVELKSNFDTQKIKNAFYQIIISFIKMHAWLSVCKHYNPHNIRIHFIVACKRCKDDANIMLRIAESQQLGEVSFETKFLKPLLQKHIIKVKLSNFRFIQQLPFNDCINEKEVIMYLQVTDNPEDSQTNVSLVGC